MKLNIEYLTKSSTDPRQLTDIVEADGARPRVICEVIPGDGNGDNSASLLVQPRPRPGLSRAELASPRGHQHRHLTDQTGPLSPSSHHKLLTVCHIWCARV